MLAMMLAIQSSDCKFDTLCSLRALTKLELYAALFYLPGHKHEGLPALQELCLQQTFFDTIWFSSVISHMHNLSCLVIRHCSVDEEQHKLDELQQIQTLRQGFKKSTCNVCIYALVSLG